jgi:hypothetical protein
MYARGMSALIGKYEGSWNKAFTWPTRRPEENQN